MFQSLIPTAATEIILTAAIKQHRRLGWLPNQSYESQDLTCQTASDQIAFCMRAAEFRACHSGMVALSAWARWAVQPHSRVAVRRRHRA
jgi:hypothetical protein